MAQPVIINKRATAQVTRPGLDGTYGQVETHYEENINMYNEPPQNVISLHEFSKMALDRLQVLKKIEFM
jgi:hypothetical protein